MKMREKPVSRVELNAGKWPHLKQKYIHFAKPLFNPNINESVYNVYAFLKKNLQSL